MTRKTRWVAAALGLLFVAAVAFFVAADRRGPVISLEMKANLKTGMLPFEAEAVIGLPPGDYTTRALRVSLPPEQDHQRRWWTDEGVFELTFDIFGGLSQQNFVMEQPSWWERLRARVGFGH